MSLNMPEIIDLAALSGLFDTRYRYKRTFCVPLWGSALCGFVFPTFPIDLHRFTITPVGKLAAVVV